MSFCFAIVAFSVLSCKVSAYTSNGYEYDVIGNTYARITGYSGTSSSVAIPATLPNPAQSNNAVPVKIIYQNAFKNKTIITSLTIGSNVETIGYEAFYGCSNIQNVLIPSNVSKIESNAFSNCGRLYVMTFNRSMPSISNYNYSQFFADNDTTPLTHIFVSAGARDVYKSLFPEDMFYFDILNIGDAAPYSYTISNGEAKITKYNITNIYNTRQEIVIPNVLGGAPVRTVGAEAFKGRLNVLGADPRSIDFPGNIRTVEESAFDGCVSINNIFLNLGLEKIKFRAFAKTKISYMWIPETVTTIEAAMAPDPDDVSHYYVYQGVFAGCNYLTQIIMDRDISAYGHSYNMEMFAQCPNIVQLKVPNTALSAYVSLFRFYGFSKIGY